MVRRRKAKKAKPAIVLIVEGPSDQTALEGYLECVFPNCRIGTHVYHGDPTTGMDRNDEKIPNFDPRNEVESGVIKVLLENGWKPQDVTKVIQITDTDGAYVEDSYVEEDKDIEGKTLCTDEALLSKNPTKTKTRNRYKRCYTLELLSRSKLRNYGWNIDYELYYMSTNLEHVTQGSNQYFTDFEKNDMAQEFRDRCFEDENYASKLFSDLSLTGKTLAESWDFILSDGHSLKRHTNLGLLNP